MGLWPFGRKKDDHSVEALLAQANAASPTRPAVPAGTPPTGTPVDTGFRMPVDDVFSIQRRGTVVTGRIEAGTVTKGMSVQVVRAGKVEHATTVTGVEMFRKVLDTARAGDNVGLLLEGLEKADLQAGDLLQG